MNGLDQPKESKLFELWDFHNSDKRRADPQGGMSFRSPRTVFGEDMALSERLRQQHRFLTTKELMELLQLRRNTVCDWVAAGKLPAVRTSSGYRFDPDALAEWLEARTIRIHGGGK